MKGYARGRGIFGGGDSWWRGMVGVDEWFIQNGWGRGMLSDGNG